MYRLHNLADILRGAGLQVVEHDGWQTRGHADRDGVYRGLVDVLGIVLHHDATPPGDTPGMADYLIRNLEDPNSKGDAQIWVDRAGRWHLLGAGKAWHAGQVNEVRFSNSYSVGIETDHTVGEDWPPVMLDSIRRGIAAIQRGYGLGADSLGFHKTVCVPVGRKVDPDGLDLATERAAIAAILNGKPQEAPVKVQAAAQGVKASVPAFPLPAGYYFGPKSGPKESVSGYYSHADDLKVWQTRMAERGWKIVPDGLYGPSTEAVVRSFQKEKSLTVDGKIGPATWAAAWTAAVS